MNGQSAAKYLSEVIASYEEGSQTSDLSRRLSDMISETGDIELYCLEDKIPLKNVSGIYLLISEDKVRIYVGSSINVYNRVRHHRSTLKNNTHHNKHFNNLYNKNIKFYYGFLEKTTDLTNKEHYYINLLNATSSINKTTDTLRNFYNDKLIRSNIKRCSKRVYVYNMEGQYLDSYISISECARVLFKNIKYNTKISAICLGKSQSLKGYRFNYKKLKKLATYSRNVNTTAANLKCSKKIKCLNNNVIYESISEACRKLGIPSSSYIYKNRYKHYNFIKI